MEQYLAHHLRTAFILDTVTAPLMGHITKHYTGLRHRTCQLETPFQSSSWPIVRDFLTRIAGYEVCQQYIIALSCSDALESPFKTFLNLIHHLKVVGVEKTHYLIISPNSFPCHTSRQLLIRERTARRLLQHCKRHRVGLSTLKPDTPCYGDGGIDSLQTRLERLAFAS